MWSQHFKGKHKKSIQDFFMGLNNFAETILAFLSKLSPPKFLFSQDKLDYQFQI